MIPKRRILIHQSLTRPILLGGAEREFTIVNVTIILALLFGCGLSLTTLMAALILATLGQTCLVLAAKADPQLSKIYRRHIRYRDFYSAQTNALSRRTYNAPTRLSL